MGYEMEHEAQAPEQPGSTSLSVALQQACSVAAAHAQKGLETDGAQHKQWYLEQVILALGFQLPPEGSVERGEAP